jgi:hypothetical protein
MGSCASLETGNPSRNGATRNFEYINAFYCWCPPSTSLLQERPSSQFQREVPFPDEERNVPLSGEVYLMGCESLACVTRCIRFSWPISGATHKSCGILTSSLAHSREAMKCAYKLHLMDRSRTFMVPRSHFSQKRRRC